MLALFIFLGVGCLVIAAYREPARRPPSVRDRLWANVLHSMKQERYVQGGSLRARLTLYGGAPKGRRALRAE